MTKEELENLEPNELIRLKQLVIEVIAEYEEKRKSLAIAAAEKAAAEAGYTLSELVGSKGAKRHKKVNPPKYQNPDNKNQTWTGRGRQPNWIKEAFQSGKSFEDFKIT